MKKSIYEKKKLVLTVAVCVLFIATAFSSAAGNTLGRRNSATELKELDDSGTKASSLTSRPFRPLAVPPWFYEIFNNDWNYWTKPPDMYAIPTGNVGIGTTNPTSKLEVVGNVEADSFTINGVYVGTSTDSYWNEDGSGNIYYNAGRVGIGTSTPVVSLHNDGDFISKGPWVDVRAYGSFSAAINAIGSDEKTLLIPNQQTVSANEIVPYNVHLWFTKGGSLSIDNGVTLTINGPVTAPLTQIFSGDGTVYGDMGTNIVRAEWWGASLFNPDNSVPINAAIDCVAHQGSGGIVEISPYGYTIENTIYLKRGVFLVSPSWYGAIINYRGTGTAISLGDGSTWRAIRSGIKNIDLGMSEQKDGTIGLHIVGAGEYLSDVVFENMAIHKFDTGIHIDDGVVGLTFRNVKIQHCKNSSNTSTAVKLDGDFAHIISFYDCHIVNCDLGIEASGNTYGFNWIGGSIQAVRNIYFYHAARFTGENSSFRFEGVYWEGSPGFVYSSPSVSSHVVKNCIIIGPNVNVPPTNVANNTIDCNAACGEITGNFFWSSGGHMPGDAYTIKVASASNVIVAGNAWSGNLMKRLAPGSNTGDSIILVDNNLRVTSSCIEMDEMSEPNAPSSNKARLFIEDDGSGKTRLMIRFPSGISQQIAIEP